MQWFCASVGKELGLRVRKEEYWDDIFGANDNSRDVRSKDFCSRLEILLS